MIDRKSVRGTAEPVHSTLNVNCLGFGSPAVKKGRHRRFEEARKLKQSGPSAYDLGLGGNGHHEHTQDDEYAALAEKYGVTFEDEDEETDD
jgi:hypothetical protein